MADKKEREKREVPASLQRLLSFDKVVTKTFCNVMEKFLPYTKYRKHYKFLEYSCHALPWFFACFFVLWFLWNEALFQTQVNLLFGILIAETLQWCGKKAFATPVSQDGRITWCNNSFPSGCATISTFITCFFCYLNPLYKYMKQLFIAWAVTVCFTRVLSRQHTAIDVLGGICLGYTAAWILCHLWLALTLDCLVVAVTKALVRRRRPAGNNNDMFLSVGVDAYSFPSGHVSRSVMITYFCSSIIQSNFIVVLIIFIWAVTISVSRILLKRHHILDVLGGVVLGLAEGWLISVLWLSHSTSVWLVRYLSDEAVDLEGLQDQDPID